VPCSNARLPELLLHRVHRRRRFAVRKRQRLKRPGPTFCQVPSASARRGGQICDLFVVNIVYHLIVHLFFRVNQSESIRHLSRPRRMHLRHHTCRRRSLEAPGTRRTSSCRGSTWWENRGTSRLQSRLCCGSCNAQARDSSLDGHNHLSDESARSPHAGDRRNRNYTDEDDSEYLLFFRDWHTWVFIDPVGAWLRLRLHPTCRAYEADVRDGLAKAATQACAETAVFFNVPFWRKQRNGLTK